MTVSANKLLGLGDINPGKVIFSGSDAVQERRITASTCALLISQSGQTFPTLHATHKFANICPQNLWILTGCPNSKMKLAMREAYVKHNLTYGNNRVITNHSGHRPAEPTTVAIAATFHTLTRLLLLMIDVCQRDLPQNQLRHSWENNYKTSAELEIGSRKSILVDKDSTHIVMNLTEGCTRDLNNLVDTTVVTNIASIVGYIDDLDQNDRLEDTSNKFTSHKTNVHEALIKQGRKWGRHIAEPWNITLFVGFYLLISVGFNLPLFGTLVTIIYNIVLAAGVQPVYCPQDAVCTLVFNPRQPDLMTSQPAMYTILGLFIQIVDAVWYIYLAKVKSYRFSNIYISS